MADYRFALKFEFERGKPIYFNYIIDVADYETFYAIVSGFFTDELSEEQHEVILRVYPHLEYMIKNVKGEYIGYNLRRIFARDFHLERLIEISENEYEVRWRT
jgi:hypothetical protein